MRRVEKILEAASHPNTPPAEALAALALFRSLIDREGGVSALFERTSIAVEPSAAATGFGLLGRGFPRRNQAEIEELRRQVELGRVEAQNLRTYAERGFSAEQSVRTLEGALAAAQAEIAQLRAQGRGTPAPDPTARDEIAALQRQLERAERRLLAAADVAQERDEAQERIVQLTNAGVDYHRRLQGVEMALAEALAAATRAQKDNEAAHLRLAELATVSEDQAERLRADDARLAESDAARRRAEDALAQAVSRETAPRVSPDRLADHTKHLSEIEDRLAESDVVRRRAEDARDEALARLAAEVQDRRQLADRLAALTTTGAEQDRRFAQVEDSLAESETVRRRAKDERDEALAQAARIAEARQAAEERSLADVNALRLAEQQRDEALRTLDREAGGDDRSRRLADAETSARTSAAALQRAERERNEALRRLSDRSAADDIRGREHRAARDELASLRETLRATEGERDDAHRRLDRSEEECRDSQRQIRALEDALARSEATARQAERQRDDAVAGRQDADTRLATMRIECEAATDGRRQAESRLERLTLAMALTKQAHDNAARERDDALRAAAQLRKLSLGRIIARTDAGPEIVLPDAAMQEDDGKPNDPAMPPVLGSEARQSIDRDPRTRPGPSSDPRQTNLRPLG